DFDPLFDDGGSPDESSSALSTTLKPAPKPAFTLSLPTFERSPPIVEPVSFGDSSLRERSPTSAELSDFFDQNVGTIALSGSHSLSEHPLLSIASPCSSTGVNESIIIAESRRSNTSSEGSRSRRSKSKSAGPKKGSIGRPGVRKDKGKAKVQSHHTLSTCDAVLQRLAQDPNVMPLLQAIVEYVYRAKLIPESPQTSSTTPTPSIGDPPQPSPSMSSQVPAGSMTLPTSVPQPPPFKRRKLNRIPAGAEDWAIPFPFQEGQKPKQYSETWDSRRMVLLLQSLLRNLRNWKSQHGVVRVRPQPSARHLRFEMEHPSPQRPNPQVEGTAGETESDASGDMFDREFLAQMELFDLGAIDQLLMSVSTNGDLSLLSDQMDGMTDGSPHLDLGGFLDPTMANLSWTGIMNAHTQPLVPPILDPPDASQAQTINIGMAIDAAATDLYNGGSSFGNGETTMVGFSFPDILGLPDIDWQPSHLGLEFLDIFTDPKQTTGYQADTDTEMYTTPIDPILAELDLTVSRGTTSVPSMTASPSTLVPTEIATPMTNVASQILDAPTLPFAESQRSITPVPSPLPVETIGHHPVPAISKRGRGRSTAAIRRDLNKQARGRGETTSVPPDSPSPIGDSQPPTVREKRKMRASEATVKRREETLEKAREWRGMLEQQLQDARRMRWEVMMEGLVLRETAGIIRDGPDGDSIMMDNDDG
ncbi:hypothetical protein FRC16_006362, partial [Serendipita sp. 398]